MNKTEVLTDDEIYVAWPSAPFVDRTEAKEYGRAIEQAIISKLTAGVELPPLPSGVGEGCTLAQFLHDYARQAIAADRARLAGQEAVALTAAQQRMLHDFPALQQFHTKHALGPMMPPSCLCCGQQTHPITRPVAVKHMELPGIVVCQQCHSAAISSAPAQAEKVEPVATAPCNGMNCGCTDGVSHSLECHAEPAAAIAGGSFVPAQSAPQSLLDAAEKALMEAAEKIEGQVPLGSPVKSLAQKAGAVIFGRDGQFGNYQAGSVLFTPTEWARFCKLLKGVAQ